MLHLIPLFVSVLLQMSFFRLHSVEKYLIIIISQLQTALPQRQSPQQRFCAENIVYFPYYLNLFAVAVVIRSAVLSHFSGKSDFKREKFPEIRLFTKAAPQWHTILLPPEFRVQQIRSFREHLSPLLFSLTEYRKR